MVVPFAEFNAIIGFLIFQHHTSPGIRWYADEAQWSAAPAQIEGVQHVLFPGVLKVLFQNIMEHHAHHVNPTISLHQLRPAQTALEASLGSKIRTSAGRRRVRRGVARVQALRLRDAPLARFDGTYTTEPI